MGITMPFGLFILQFVVIEVDARSFDTDWLARIFHC